MPSPTVAATAWGGRWEYRAAGGALVIADWPEHLPDTLALLDAAGVPVTMWRWTQDPRQWLGWPGAYVQRCQWDVAANEPDLASESCPSWYEAAIGAWRRAGGKIVEPALSDESRYAVIGMERYEEALVLSTGRGYDARADQGGPVGAAW